MYCDLFGAVGLLLRTCSMDLEPLHSHNLTITRTAHGLLIVL